MLVVLVPRYAAIDLTWIPQQLGFNNIYIEKFRGLNTLTRHTSRCVLRILYEYL